MRHIPILLTAGLLGLVLGGSAVAQNAAAHNWTLTDVTRTYGEPISAVRTSSGGIVMSYDHMPSRQFVSDTVFRKYPQNLWKHTTVSLQFAVDSAQRCTGVAVVFDDDGQDPKVLSGDPNAAAYTTRIRADVITAVTTDFAGKCP